MPAYSTYSTCGTSKGAADSAAKFAEDFAKKEVANALLTGKIPKTEAAKNAKFCEIYQQKYEEYYPIFLMHNINESVIDRFSPNKKFHLKHTVARFTRTNQFIHVRRDTIVEVCKFDYPIENGDKSPETKEAYLTLWPGPLDRSDVELKKITDYIATLWQQDSQRRLRYSNNNVDDQRRVILNILEELLNRNGRIDGPGFTRLLLDSDEYQIKAEESDKKPLDTILKVLLLGKRVEATRFSKSKGLWDHAMFLSFLDDSQSPKDGLHARVLDEFTRSIDHNTLRTVYRSLLSRALHTDSFRPRVDNDHHMFAILNANDCDMDFDQSNEIFKLIVASRVSNSTDAFNSLDGYRRLDYANSHVIKLGYLSLVDPPDPKDDSSTTNDRSYTSFLQGDTYASRTLTISNIDMLILNEIWEYCLNLAYKSCDPSNYNYILNLIPYKLIFASRLLDYGLHDMFACYLNSLRNAMVRVQESKDYLKDPFYDWDAIGRCVEHLTGVWEIYQGGPGYIQKPYIEPTPPPAPVHTPTYQTQPVAMNYNPPQPVEDTMQYGYQSTLPYIPNNSPRPSFSRDVSDFNPETEQIEEQPSSFIEHAQPEATVFSRPPIDELDISNRTSISNIQPSPIELLSPPSADELDVSSSIQNTSHINNNSQPLIQSFSFGKLAKSIFPKSNSKEMNLPADSEPTFVYDEQKKTWVNKDDTDEGNTDSFNEPPPVMNLPLRQNYSFNRTKTAQRYPQPSFERK